MDAMLISAPKSTKNAEKKWAPEMHHTQKRESVAFRYEVPYRYGRGQRICPYSGSITAIISVGSFAVLSIIPIISFRVCKNQRMHFIPGKVLVQHGYLSFCCNRLLFMGSSLSPIMVDGVTHHHQDRLSPWRQTILFKRNHPVSEKRRLLFPPLARYRCSVESNFAACRSRIARRTVDTDNFSSRAIVGIAGQHCPSLLARSARYRYTATAL